MLKIKAEEYVLDCCRTNFKKMISLKYNTNEMSNKRYKAEEQTYVISCIYDDKTNEVINYFIIKFTLLIAKLCVTYIRRSNYRSF